MEQYALVFFPESIPEEIQTFRKKYDPQWKVIQPHITIVFPFLGIPEASIITHTSSIVKNIKPFEIRLKKFMKSFDHCLFLLVQEGKENIYALHEQLYTGILTSYLKDDIPFIPHMTIGYFGTTDDQLKKELYEKALAEAITTNFELSSSFNTLSLIKGDGITPAKIVRTFTLQA
ncbi:MAG TPA: 2'-5' RNA ligase family protein [Candidatus Saccharimonadales bacterium]|nr:2'-5' RNA ligase family protein [Candidatus Saccharimonadales bacterium]